MTTTHGTPLEFVLTGIAVIVSSPGWGWLFAVITNRVWFTFTGMELEGGDHSKPAIVGFTASTAMVGLVLIIVGAVGV